MATLKDIARLSGVSTATVSYVVNQGPRAVLPETRARVLKAIEELNYRPSAAGRGLKGKSTDTFGVVFPHVVASPLDNDYFAPILAGILDRSTEENQVCMLFTGMTWQQTDENLSQYLDGRCDGLLLIAPRTQSKLISELRRRSMPFVVVGTHVEGEPTWSVDVDNVAGAQVATEHLLGLGHRRVGMILGNAFSSSSIERYEGFRRAHGERGLVLFSDLVVQSRYQHEAAKDSARALLSRPLSERPTAIFCASDLIAIAALEVAHELNLQVPRDLSLVGFDDLLGTRQSDPPLTTMRHPLRDIGSRAATLLFERVRQKDLAPANILFPAELVARESVGPPSRG